MAFSCGAMYLLGIHLIASILFQQTEFKARIIYINLLFVVCQHTDWITLPWISSSFKYIFYFIWMESGTECVCACANCVNGCCCTANETERERERTERKANTHRERHKYTIEMWWIRRGLSRLERLHQWQVKYLCMCWFKYPKSFLNGNYFWRNNNGVNKKIKNFSNDLANICW